MIHEIPFPGLFDEMKNWADDHSKKLFEEKVRWVHTKCLRRGKLELAKRIENKYKRIINRTSRYDSVTALQIALTAQKQKG